MPGPSPAVMKAVKEAGQRRLARVQKEYAAAIAEPEPDDEQGLEARKRQITAKKVMMGESLNTFKQFHC